MNNTYGMAMPTTCNHSKVRVLIIGKFTYSAFCSYVNVYENALSHLFGPSSSPSSSRLCRKAQIMFRSLGLPESRSVTSFFPFPAILRMSAGRRVDERREESMG